MTCAGRSLREAWRDGVALEGWLLGGQEAGVSQRGSHQGLGHQGAPRVAELQRVLVGHRDGHGHGEVWSRYRRLQKRSRAGSLMQENSGKCCLQGGQAGVRLALTHKDTQHTHTPVPFGCQMLKSPELSWVTLVPAHTIGSHYGIGRWPSNACAFTTSDKGTNTRSL